MPVKWSMLEVIENIRRNHALEHATVQLLIARLGPTFHLAGRASSDGFFILGKIPPADLADCAHDALDRLQRGESYWAITPLCGTNIAAAGILASLATLAVTSTQERHMGKAMTAGMLAIIASQPIGRWIQRHLTTNADLLGTEIVSVETRVDNYLFKVKTRRLSAGS